MARLTVEYYSPVLTGNTSALVILPEERDFFLSGGIRRGADGKIPVLYLLHGMGDDETVWARYTNLEREALSRGIAVVCPRVHSQSFYCNMPRGLRYFDFIADDLPALMQRLFPQLSDRREDRYLAGVSMGGYGALKIGLSRPDTFGHLGCLSSGNFVYMEPYLPPEKAAPPFLLPFYGVPRNAFGTGTAAEAAGTEHDLYTVLDRAIASGKPLPDIEMICGDRDFVTGLSDKTAEYFSARLPAGKFEYKKFSGSHNWIYWNDWLPMLLDDMGLTSQLRLL